MTKFVFYFEPNGKNFYLKAANLKAAKAQLKKSLGGLPYYVGETGYKSVRKTVSQSEFEVSLLN